MIRYAVIILSVFLTACLSGEEEVIDPVTEKQWEPRTDLITDSLYNSVSGTSGTFSLLLPGNYRPENSSPVILFLDPHASGSLPIKKYRALCNEYGYIMVGSNSSKNGMNSEEAKRLVIALIEECREILNIDPSRIYVAGFSGGARVAGTLTDQALVSGILFCSAGFEVKPGISK